jgi:hypothetical protein
MQSTETETEPAVSATNDQATVREVLDDVCADGRSALSAPEAKRVCDV